MSDPGPDDNGYTGPQTGGYSTEQKLAAQVGALTDAERERAQEMAKEPTHRIDSASPGGHDLTYGDDANATQAEQVETAHAAGDGSETADVTSGGDQGDDEQAEHAQQ